nr:MAG TPA: hypothetical protein [Caudoviricetes sp.]
MGLRYRPYGRINTNVSSSPAREGRRGFQPKTDIII